MAHIKNCVNSATVYNLRRFAKILYKCLLNHQIAHTSYTLKIAFHDFLKAVFRHSRVLKLTFKR